MSDFPPGEFRDTLCRCATCGREEHVNFADCLRLGSAPYCHGRPMRLVETSANVARDYDRANARLVELIADALRVSPPGPAGDCP